MEYRIKEVTEHEGSTFTVLVIVPAGDLSPTPGRLLSMDHHRRSLAISVSMRDCCRWKAGLR